jgi:hypothetical protein
MKLQLQLSKLLTFCFFILVSANLLAETKWEVATVFLGNKEDVEFQQDVEKNLEEISKIKTSANLKVSTFRESPANLNERAQLPQFLKKSFQDIKSKKMLVIYGHGEGPLGLKDLNTNELKNILAQSKIKFDVIWYDSCFLSNLEFLYELRKAGSISIASEEAEFSAGLPFYALSDLPNFDSISEAAKFMAQRFIESYSYLKDGDQRDAVYKSSATISVINNAELESFTNVFKKISTYIKNLSTSQAISLKHTLTKKYRMDHPELIDLGHMLIELRSINMDPKIDTEITQLIRLLNIESVKKLRTNPRVHIIAPEAGAFMVFGFNNWENGSKEEYNSNTLFKEIIPTKLFAPGLNNKSWPVKKFEYASTYITPFAPGINSFEYYFVSSDGNTLLTKEAISITRTQDVIENVLSKSAPGAFLVYSAYTQQVGEKAEKYTGVNITLFDTTPSMDYFELEFNKITNWLKF